MNLNNNNLYNLYKKTAPDTPVLLIIITLLFAQAATSLLMPWLAGNYVNTLTGISTITVNSILFSWLGIMILQAVLGYSSSQIISGASIKTREKLNKILFEKMQTLSIAWFHNHEAGNVLSLFNKDVNNVSQFTATASAQLVLPLMTFFGALFIMSSIQTTIAIILLTTIPLLIIINQLLSRNIRPLSRQVSEQHATCLSRIESWLELTPLIKAFNRESTEQHKYNSDLQRLSDIEIQQQKQLNRIGPTMRIIIGISITGVLWLTASQVESQHISTGELVTLLMYSAMLIQPISNLSSMYGRVRDTLASADRLQIVLKEKPEVDSGTLNMPPKPYTIAFNNISFSYPNRPIVLDNYSLLIKAEETYILEAPNGSGKSTLFHLLQRHYVPKKGNITINGIDIQNIQLKQLRSAIALVPQHIMLANDTIAENIAYSNPDASWNEIETAAKQALASEFINKLPDKYDTKVGPQGTKLSGGQQQRIALARALLKQSSILLLDEATSMFDSASLKQINERNKNTLKHKTAIEISHSN